MRPEINDALKLLLRHARESIPIDDNLRNDYDVALVAGMQAAVEIEISRREYILHLEAMNRKLRTGAEILIATLDELTIEPAVKPAVQHDTPARDNHGNRHIIRLTSQTTIVPIEYDGGPEW